MKIIIAKTECNKKDNMITKYVNTINTDDNDDENIDQYDKCTNITLKEEIENVSNSQHRCC